MKMLSNNCNQNADIRLSQYKRFLHSGHEDGDKGVGAHHHLCFNIDLCNLYLPRFSDKEKEFEMIHFCHNTKSDLEPVMNDRIRYNYS